MQVFFENGASCRKMAAEWPRGGLNNPYLFPRQTTNEGFASDRRAWNVAPLVGVRRAGYIASVDETAMRSVGQKASQRMEPQMRVAQSVAEILSKHVVLEVEGIDRMYLNVYVARLRIIEGLLGFKLAA
jgi:hypothetical protein